MRKILIFVAICSPIFALFSYPDCTGTPNTQPVIDIEPQLVDNVTNGNKYLIQSPENNTNLTIIALKGDWYDIGLAYGQLMKDEINDAVPGMFNYLVNNTDGWLPIVKQFLPFYLQWIPNLLSLDTADLLKSLLELQYAFTAGYTPQRYADQLQGMADGSGVDITLLTYVNLFPELIRAQCSMVGAWGSASKDTVLVQLRALDFDYMAYIVNFPTAIIYFPEEEGSNPFATFGFAGMIGAISGYSTKMALSQKVWDPISTDPESLYGEPFAYMLRDTLQFGNDLESAVGVLFGNKRTCRTHVGLGSKKDNSFEGIEMSFNEIDIFNDVNYTYYSNAHPQMNGIMFWDKYIQPSTDRCLGSILQQNYGQIDAEFLFRQAAPLHQTGDTQLVVYQFENDTIYLSYSDPKTQTLAYTRPLVKLNMGELLTYEELF